MAVEHQFRLIHPIESEYGLKLQTHIPRWIDHPSGQADECHVREIASAKFPVSDEDAQWFEVRGPDGHVWGIIIIDSVECECNQMLATGIPCPYLIDLFRACGHGPFPVQFIDPLWIPNFDMAFIPPLP
jgi:hypothetical protein